MLKSLLILIIVLIAALPAFAQDEEAPDPVCEANVPAEALAALDGIADLTPEEALARVIDARVALQAVEQQCARAGVVLSRNYITPDGTFALVVPQGWLLGTYNPTEAGGILFMGNSATAERLLQVENPRLLPGEQSLQIVVGLPPADSDITLESVMSDFRTPVNAVYPELSTTVLYEVDGRSLAWFAYRGDGFDGVVVGIAMEDRRFAVVRGITSGGDLDALTVIAEFVALSVR